MSRFAHFAALLLFIIPTADPAPPTAQQLLDAVKAAQAKKAVAGDEEAKARAAFEAELARLISEAKKLGIDPCQSGPGPKPPDPPKPQPTAAKLYIVVVEESAQRTPAQGKVLGDLPFWQGLSSLGHGWKVVDKDLPEATAKHWYSPERAAQAGGLPYILAIDWKTGDVLRAVPLPATTADISSLVKELTGGGK